jgi:hypothetical protein
MPSIALGLTGYPSFASSPPIVRSFARLWQQRSEFAVRELGWRSLLWLDRRRSWRRREASQGKFESLPHAEQERIKQQANARLRKEDRRRVEKRRANLLEHETEGGNDAGEKHDVVVVS